MFCVDINAVANLPESLEHILQGQDYFIDDIGRSNSTVIIFPEKVLKIRTSNEETGTEYKMLQWLQNKLPVPRVICHEIVDGIDYLLMSKVKGEMACNPQLMSDPIRLTHMLADALKFMWSVDISNCPVSWMLDRKLSAATVAVESGEVDVGDAEPTTFGENGFRDPAHLLTWLKTERHPEDLVLSHGDFCLPNIFFESGNLSGVIDLGRSGIADRWQDIALCYRSLKHNYEGRYGGKVYEEYDSGMFFEALGIKPDWNKLNYYILLDELF